MSPFTGYIIFSLTLTLFYFGSLIHFLTDYEPTKCEMTYMFEYPQFVRIESNVDQVYKRYGLYAYSEGRHTESIRNMKFNGIPVLFIPGSGGSHKQVRSFASIALRKWINSRLSYHFDYFTIDLNNELSGLNGALLEDQLHYVNQSIKTVMELYEKNKIPIYKLVLIGHSMGGVIAKAILTSLPEDNTLVPILIALSAPLTRPVAELDFYFNNFYRKRILNATIPKDTVFISIAGGYDDFMVAPYLTQDGDINLIATCVPKSWVSPDHKAILWCKQLVMAINRALFESVDTISKQISNDRDYRITVFRHHLIKHSGIKVQQLERYSTLVPINSQGEWFESIYRQYSIRLHKGSKEVRWYMMPIMIQPQYEALTLVGLNLDQVDWVFACPAINIRAASRICDNGRHLTHLSEISPSLKYKRRTLRLNMFDLKRNYTTATHVVARVLPTDEPLIFHIDIHSPAERTITLNNPPKWYSFKEEILIEETLEKAIEYNLVLPYFNHITQNLILNLIPTECTSHSHHATGSLLVPWDNHDMHGFVTETEKRPITFRLYKSKPTNLDQENSATIRLTLDPTCRYKVGVKYGLQFGSLARFYSPLLLANIAAIILMTLRYQLLNISEKEQCSFFFTAIKSGAKPFYIITVVRILSKFTSFKPLALLIPESDWKVLNDENLDFIVLPVLLYMTSVGIVWTLGLGLSISFMFFESTIHKIALKFVSRTFRGTAAWTDHLMSAFEKVPGVVAATLIMMSFTTSGGLAICLATGFYFLKLTQMAQDFIEDLVKSIIKALTKNIREKILNSLKRRWVRFWHGSKAAALLYEAQEAIKASETTPVQEERKEIEEIQPSTSYRGKAASTTTIEDKDTQTNINNKKILYYKADPNNPGELLISDAIDIEYETPIKIEIIENDKVKTVTGEELIEMLESKLVQTDSTITNTTDQTDSTYTDGRESTEETETSEGNEEIQDNAPKETKKTDFIPNIDISWIKEIMENNEIFFHFTIFLLYFIVACLNVPSVITWARNYRYNKHLETDPAFIPGVILSVCALPLWQFEFPRVDRHFYLELSQFVHGMAVISLIYGVISIYRLSFILSITVAAITIHQIFAMKKPESDESNQSKDDDDEMSYQNRVKAKWE